MKLQKMYIIVFGIFIVKLQISASEPQFPPHIDLQKIGKVIFNNVKFNILKSTTHRVTDHFKDFMLRTKDSYHPAKRVFIDNNGFRHDWSGFGEKTRSLRNTNLKHVSGSSENASETDIITMDGNDNTTAAVKDINISSYNVSSKEKENNNQEVENYALDNNDTVQNLTEEDTETPESKKTIITTNLFPAIQKNNSRTKITMDNRLREGSKVVDNKNPAPKKSTVSKLSDVVKKVTPATSRDAKNKDNKGKAKKGEQKPKTGNNKTSDGIKVTPTTSADAKNKDNKGKAKKGERKPKTGTKKTSEGKKVTPANLGDAENKDNKGKAKTDEKKQKTGSNKTSDGKKVTTATSGDAKNKANKGKAKTDEQIPKTASNKTGDGKKVASATSGNPKNKENKGKAKKDEQKAKTGTTKTGDVKKVAPATSGDAKNKDNNGKAETDVKSKDVKTDEKEERTVARTTFFCPYFGTITMSAFID